MALILFNKYIGLRARATAVGHLSFLAHLISLNGIIDAKGGERTFAAYSNCKRTPAKADIQAGQQRCAGRVRITGCVLSISP